MRNDRAGFSLVELVLVIGIVAILVGLLIPAVQQSRDAARRIVCLNKQRQLGVALQSHEAARGVFPAGARTQHPHSTGGICPTPYENERQPWLRAREPWTVSILPYLEEQALNHQFELQGPFVSDLTDKAADAQVPNLFVQTQVVAFLQCPSDSNATQLRPSNSFFGVMGDGLNGKSCSTNHPDRVIDGDGMAVLNRRVSISDVIDGTSKTFHVGEQRYQLPEQTWASGPFISKQHGTVKNVASTRLRMNAVDFRPPSKQVLFRGDTTARGKLDFDYDAMVLLSEQSFSSYHPGGCHFLRVDGSAKFESQGIDMAVYRAFATRAGEDR